MPERHALFRAGTRTRLRAICASFLLLIAQESQGRTLTDSLGRNITVPDHPSRIVTLMPSLGELAAEFCGNDLSRIVGVSDFTTYPPGLAKIRSIGPYHRVNLESVVALKPDLVLAGYDGNSRDQVHHLQELGIPVVTIKAADFSDVETSIRLVGTAMGEPDAAAGAALRFRKAIEQFKSRSRTANLASPKVLLQVGDDPLVVAGGKTLLDEALRTVGGINIYGNSATAWPHPSIEDVIQKAPDRILILALNPETTAARQSAQKWTTFPSVPAVKNRKVLILAGEADALLRPGLRLLEGLSLLEKRIRE